MFAKYMMVIVMMVDVFLSILILKAGLKPLFHAFKGFLAFQSGYVILTEKAPPHIIRGSLMCNRM